MLKKLSYKKKTLWLLFIFAVFLLFAYMLSIGRTVDLVKQCNDFEAKLEKLQDAPLKIEGIQKELAAIDSKIGMNIVSDIDFQDLLLEKVSHYCQQNNLILREFPKTHSYREKDFEIETNIVMVEGPFIKLLKLVYSLEQEYHMGRVISTRFETVKDMKTRSLRLVSTIYFQNVKTIDNEKI